MKAMASTTRSTPARRFINGAKEGLRPDGVEAYDSHRRRLIEIYQLYEAQCQREGVVDFAELLRLNCCRATRCALPAGSVSATSWSTSSRIPTLQYKWLRLLAGGGGDLRRGRRRPVHLRVPGRQRRQHGRLRARLRAWHGDPAGRTIVPMATSGFGQRAIGHNSGRLGKNLWTEQGEGEPVRVIEQPSDGMKPSGWWTRSVR